MICEKCGHEMMQQELTAFYTHYACFMCGHEVYFCPLDDDERAVVNECDMPDWAGDPDDGVFDPDHPENMSEDDYRDWLHRSGAL